MKFFFDAKSDTLYLRLSAAEVVESEEVKPGVVFDFDRNGHIVAIEILHAASQLLGNALRETAAE